MRKITIVGGGQSGLQLGLGLLKHGYDVTLYSDRTPGEIRYGNIMSTQCMFHSALETERRLGIHLWEDACPKIEGMAIQIAGAVHWDAKLDHPAQSVDQRMKFARWMELFEESGGHLIISKITPDALVPLETDLIIIATGKGFLGELFEIDHDKTPYDKPQRVLAVTCVHNITPREPFEVVSFNIVPGVGEYFVMPGLTNSGACYFMVAEGIPGGALDCWSDVKTPEQHLTRLKEFLQQYVPWEAERSQNMVLTDQGATLRGSFAPTVRQPVGYLFNGKPVLGMGDVVVLNDPITGQGSNNAARCADTYLKSILEHSSQRFNEEWMQKTFDTYWNEAQWATIWTNAMLQPPPPHVLKVLTSAATLPGVAHHFVNAFDNPRQFFPWLGDSQETDKFISSYA